MVCKYKHLEDWWDNKIYKANISVSFFGDYDHNHCKLLERINTLKKSRKWGRVE